MDPAVSHARATRRHNDADISTVKLSLCLRSSSIFLCPCRQQLSRERVIVPHYCTYQPHDDYLAPPPDDEGAESLEESFDEPSQHLKASDVNRTSRRTGQQSNDRDDGGQIFRPRRSVNQKHSYVDVTSK